MKKILIIVVIYLLSSCLKIPNSSVVPPDEMLVLSGVLQNIRPYQKIKLFRAFSAQEIDSLNNSYLEDSLSFYFGISGAEIVLSTLDSNYRFVENINKKGEYLLNDFLPKSGEDYFIQIKKEGFKPLVGHTKYLNKQPFNIQYQFNKNGDLKLFWNKIDGARGYRIDLFRWERIKYGPLDYYTWGLKRIYLETNTEIQIPQSVFQYKNNITKIKLLIWAVDENYYQYYNFENYYDPFEFHLIDYGNFSTVENGLGYFGSVYGDSIIINLIE